MRIPRPEASRLGAGLLAAILAAALFWIAYDNGSYALTSRNALAIAVWWALVVLIAFGLVPRQPPPRASLLLGGLLAAFVLWTSASLLWSVSYETAFDEVDRAALYLGVFVLVSVLPSGRSVATLLAGLAVAISAVATVAIVARLIPGSFPGRGLDVFLPASAARLSFPLGYWNGLAILVALGIPLLLGIAVVSDAPVVRGLSLAPIPIIACVIYLASSRGGVLTAIVATAGFLVLTERRWAALGALATSALGCALAVAVLMRRDELVNGPLGTDLVERQGRSAALLIAFACATTGVLYWGGSRLLRSRDVTPPPAVGRAAALAMLGALAVGVILANPVGRLRDFKAPPGQIAAIEQGDFVEQHLVSSSGSGRWQFWSAALDQWRSARLWGDGAGSYESWWAQHGSIGLFVRDAHSLYLETLGELGVVGVALIVALVGVGSYVGVRRASSASGDLRVYAAALTGVFLGYVTAAAFDWMWELTVVSIVGVVALALVSGRATVAPVGLGVIESDGRSRLEHRRFAVGVAAILVACGVVFAEAVPLLAQREIERSQGAARRGDLQEALDAAGGARDMQPWAASPYLQLALVSEQAGTLPQARRWINLAIARDRSDWRLWLTSARIETKLGHVGAATASLRRAVALNPRSPLLKGLLPANGR